MSELKRIVYLSNEQAQTLFGTGSVTSNGITVNYDENDLYVTPDTQLQADWEQTVATADDYIKNKPPLGSAASATVATTVGNNANLPTGAAIQTYIAGLGYSTTTGTVTSVKPGNGLINGTSGTSQTAITGSGTISIGEGKVTNAMLAGSITPAKLDSSATITIGTQSVKVGGSFTSSTLISDLGIPPSMTILSYGHSTWQDFLTAYNSNSVVYCRASSNSNPASGSQTRMAFMAYVNNETSPTEVEFQYYRSISIHNASTLNDEVYVYKLNDTGNWRVITRKASVSQIKAGTNISISYGSRDNSVTVNNTQTVPTASSTTPAALGTAAVGTSDDYARADHVHAKPTPADIGAAPLASPALTGTPTAPTAAAGTSTTQIATTEFVTNAVTSGISVADAMIFKGVVNSNSGLPANHTQGWTYKVGTAGTYVGKTCEVGDMIICTTSGTAANNDDWAIVQNNIDGAVTGPTTSTDAHVAVFNGNTGKIIKDSGFTIGKSVPSDAVFTDNNTTYTLTQDSSDGHKITLTPSSGTAQTITIPDNNTDTKVTSAANHYTPAEDTAAQLNADASGATAAWSIDVVKGVQLQRDGKGHVVGVSVTSGKIPANPNTDTKVRQTLSTTNKNYPLLLSYGETSNTNSNVDNVSYRANGIYANPSTGTITATNFVGKNNGFTLGMDVPAGSKLTDTTYASETAASGGTTLSLVTTGEKYIWNNKTSNVGTVTSVATGAGLTGGTITGSGTIKANLTSETAITATSKVYSIGVNQSGKLVVQVPWEDTSVTSESNHYAPTAAASAELTASASGASAAWSIDVVKGIQLQRDAKGHVTGITVTSGKIPANPNTDTKVTLAAITSNTTYYPVVGTGTGTATRQIDTTGLVYKGITGTTSTVGSSTLTLGNEYISTAAGNKKGALKLYSSEAGSTTLYAGNSGSTNTEVYLPSSSCTLGMMPFKVYISLSDSGGSFSETIYSDDITESMQVIGYDVASNVYTSEITVTTSNGSLTVTGSKAETVGGGITLLLSDVVNVVITN